MATKIKTEWELLEDAGKVKVEWLPDECSTIEDLEGDSFDPEVSGLDPEETKRQRQGFIDQVERDGVWGIVGSYHDGENWINSDSVWGFVGTTDTAYLSDVQAMTIDALKKVTHCPTCSRPSVGGK